MPYPMLLVPRGFPLNGVCNILSMITIYYILYLLLHTETRLHATGNAATIQVKLGISSATRLFSSLHRAARKLAVGTPSPQHQAKRAMNNQQSILCTTLKIVEGTAAGSARGHFRW